MTVELLLVTDGAELRARHGAHCWGGRGHGREGRCAHSNIEVLPSWRLRTIFFSGGHALRLCAQDDLRLFRRHAAMLKRYAARI